MWHIAGLSHRQEECSARPFFPCGGLKLSKLPQKIRNYFTEDAVSTLRAAIRDANGNELFAVGRLDSGDLVESIAVVARGSRSAVPALDKVVTPGEVVIHNHPSGNLTPSEADLRAAYRVGSQGAGFLIVSNEVDDVYAVVEVIQVRAQAREHRHCQRGCSIEQAIASACLRMNTGLSRLRWRASSVRWAGMRCSKQGRRNRPTCRV